MTDAQPRAEPDEVGARGLMFPEVGALIARENDGYLLVSSTGMRTRIRGPICDEIAASLARSEVTDGLRRLLPAHTALGQLASWLETTSVPLTREMAVRLDGFDTIFVELLGQCNERCVHCYADASPTVTDALPHDVVMRLVDQAHALGFKRIQFTGGDPLLCDFLPEAVERAATRPFEQIEIYTNGLALSESLLDKLAPHRPSFAFSFYSMNPEVHDAVTRTPNSHRRTLAAIDRTVARGLGLRVAIVVTTHDEDVDALVGFFRARGVETVTWTRTFSVGRGTEISDVSQRAVVSNSNAAPHVDEGGGHRSASSHTKSGKLCVTYSGDVVPCIFQRSSMLGNVLQGRSLLDIVRSPARTTPQRPLRALPMVDTVSERLQCSSCRLTDVALDWLGGGR